MIKLRKLKNAKKHTLIIKSLSALFAVVIAVSPVSLAAGSSRLVCAQTESETVTLAKKESAVESGLVKEYRAVKKVPGSKSVEILQGPQLKIKKDTQKAEKSTHSDLCALNTIQKSGKATSSLKTEAADSSQSAPNPLDSVMAFFKIYNDGINNFKMYTVDKGNGIHEFVAEYDDNNGGHHTSYSGVYYDEANSLIYGKDDTGVFAIGFNLDVGQMTIYSANSSWQRDMGFCKLYDALAPLIGENYLTVRVTFNYGGKDWLVQLWKGVYVVTMGGEIGIYQKPESRVAEFYDCLDNTEMSMSMRLLKGDKVLFSRPLQPCWWQTGFKFTPLCLPSQLTLEGSIVFPALEMKDAFIAALDKQQAGVIHYTVDGNAVNLVW